MSLQTRITALVQAIGADIKALYSGKVGTSDARLTDAREWTASTVSQAEAEAGTATTRRAWTAQRVFQAVAAWWAASADKTKLDGIQAGAQVNVGTNLAQGTRTTTAVPVTSSTGTGATLGAATTSLAGVMTAADKTKLDGVATGATANASDAQLRDRATHTGSQAISTVTGLQTALDNKINSSERGVSGGIATLDQFARIPASQLPSYVDDVLEYPTRQDFPTTGESGKIYIAINQGTAANPTVWWRWTGTTYVDIPPSPGTTDVLVEGSTNLYFSEHRVRNTVLTGLSLAVSTAVTAADSVLSAFGKIQAQLGLKANLASPTFTGDPKAPTPAADDNDTSIATTAFVRAAMALFGLNNPSTQQAWHAGNLVKQTSSTDTTAGALVTTEGARYAALSNYGAYYSASSGKNIDTLVGGESGLFSNSNPGTFPPVFGSFVYIETQQTYNGSSAVQEAYDYGNSGIPSGRRAFRVRSNSTAEWSPWRVYFHTGNFDPATKQDKSSIVSTATSRTLALTDAWNYVRPGTTSAITLTVPTNASVAFDIGTEITVRALGNITLAAASGVTLNAPSGGTLSMTARMTVTLKKVATNEWDVIGQTVAA
jgi:hypothetical protein